MLRRAAGDVSDAITGLLNGVKEVHSLAAAHEFTIGEDGSITSLAPPPVCTDADPDGSQATRDRQRIAVELQDRIQEVLRSAEDVDNDFCAVLDRILSNRVLDPGSDHTDLAAAGNSGAALGSLSIPAPPPAGATPAENAAWWATLSHDQQLVLIHDRPELVGNRDGVAAWARSQANLAMVPKLRTQLQQQYDTVLAQASGKERNTGVDDAVFFGSPGITDKPALGPIPINGNPLHDLQIPTGHAYDLAANGDPIANDVPLIGRFGPAPQTLDGMNHLSTDAALTPDGQQLTTSHGHSEYTTSINGIDTTSKYNIAAVVAGQPDLTIPAR
ncbi:hypothetical protein [Amycolatopsis taiwanensis]|uniref:hypothetical protein n=1 Tax=Amycolatopsis taiwanensis TaxID=342230 RepID=UPI000486E6DE|nr:hypothetical protein [Amycolatopsis taiwanensis]